jgi:hypothetical protein
MADLHVSKKNLSKLFSEMQGRKFIIPDFQRPYKWNIEKCETLWNDIENFALTEAKEGNDYFLGTIVTYINEAKNQEIIDGQQRLTSFFLLLRAFYKKLEDMHEDDHVVGLKNQLAPCLWDTDKFSGKVTDKTRIHIESLVATEDDNDAFHRILELGVTNASAFDNYSVNYRYFKKKCDEYAETNPMQWKELCVCILKQCIILPIECDTPETALTIFSTLNDRGMPLADSDIFKAKLYRQQPQELKREFTDTWKELTSICKSAHITIDDVFRYYTHVLRARLGEKGKEVGLRRFYAGTDGQYERLKVDGLMDDIMALANFWLCINTDMEPDEEDGFMLSIEAYKYLHCLSCYPNEFWKYATSVFYLKNKGSENFEADFEAFLKKLVAFLFAKFVDTPSINAIKDDIYSACVSIQTKNELAVSYTLHEEWFSQKMNEHGSSRISRALLLLDAYLHPLQEALIPSTFDIEHIFPKRWQDTNYNGWSIEDARLYLDRFGNKIALEKKLNIQAGNGYFGVKKLRYTDSKIAAVSVLTNYPKNDWVKEDIEEREEIFKSNIIGFFQGQLS